jgi:hypothetical protein
MKVLKVENPTWADEAHTMIDAVVTFEEIGDPIPFTAVNAANEPHTQEVWDVCVAMGPSERPAPSDEQARLIKYEEISQWRDQERESGFVEHKGKRYDRDSTARDNILGVLTTGVMPVPFWTTYDNEDEPATLDDLRQIYNLIIEAGGAIHYRQRQMKTEIAALTGRAISDYVVGWGV